MVLCLCYICQYVTIKCILIIINYVFTSVNVILSQEFFTSIRKHYSFSCISLNLFLKFYSTVAYRKFLLVVIYKMGMKKRGFSMYVRFGLIQNGFEINYQMKRVYCMATVMPIHKNTVYCCNHSVKHLVVGFFCCKCIVYFFGDSSMAKFCAVP